MAVITSFVTKPVFLYTYLAVKCSQKVMVQATDPEVKNHTSVARISVEWDKERWNRGSKGS